MTYTRDTLGLALALALPALASAQQPAAAPPLIFDGVTVIDVEQGRLLPDQRVVIVGNHIQAMGPARDVRMPASAQVVNAQGKYLIPGLWDMHVHPGAVPDKSRIELAYPLYLANGLTGIRDAKSPGPVEKIIIWQKQILAGVRVGPPRQLLAGSPIMGEYEAQKLAASGVNFFKVYPMTFKNAAIARSLGIPFGGHVNDPGEPNGIDAMTASDSGITILDHVITAGGLDKTCWGRAATVAQCQPIVERFRKNNSWFAPTVTAFYNLGSADAGINGPMSLVAQAPHVRPIAKQFARRSLEFLNGSLLHGNWLRDSTIPGARAPGDTARADANGVFAMALLQQLDMPLLAGTDALWFWGRSLGFQAVLPGFVLHTELAAFVAEGMSPLRALQAATLNPAKMLHATDSLGTVAPGKLADLVLLDANPLEDITNTTTIQAVVANGRYFDRAALDQILAGVQAHIWHRGIPADGITRP